MKIGIPRGIATFEYPVLFTSFFENLGIEIVLSDKSCKEIMEDGIHYSIDENCLASKMYMGHVKNLKDKMSLEHIDYIFIPRICSFNKTDTVCVKFYAMYDICKNIFDVPFITLNIDYLRGENEFKAFLNLGRKLNKRYIDIIKAYKKAKAMQNIYDVKKLEEQIIKIKSKKADDINILIVSHSYISKDKYMGVPVTKYLENLGVNIFYANINSSNICKKTYKKSSNNDKGYKKISDSIYWKYSKNLLNGITEYLDYVDGIIYLSVFPCGPDSLVNELSLRKVKDVPSINIILDEQVANAGLYTRLESFVDILEQKNNLEEVSCGYETKTQF
ncbi:MAG: acyl-CoA dehydratase activase-related protein [Clostridia bacterium]